MKKLSEIGISSEPSQEALAVSTASILGAIGLTTHNLTKTQLRDARFEFNQYVDDTGDNSITFLEFVASTR